MLRVALHYGIIAFAVVWSASGLYLIAAGIENLNPWQGYAGFLMVAYLLLALWL